MEITISNIISFIFNLNLWIGLAIGYILGKYYNKGIERNTKGLIKSLKGEDKR